MNRLVYSVFKAIALSIIFIFVFDIVFYIYRVTSLNARIESISTSLKKVVMENNYLPEEVADVYSTILTRLVCDYNGVPYLNNHMTASQLVQGDQKTVNTAAFIAGMRWNYKNNSTADMRIDTTRSMWRGSHWQDTTYNLVHRKMNTPANYGDIMIVEIAVDVFQPIWGWTASGAYNYTGQDATQWQRNAAVTTLTYTYYVPCLNYRTVTSNG